MMGPRASYLVTYRDDGEGRAANLRLVADWVGRLDGVELVVVEQASSSTIPAGMLPPSARHLLALNAGPFNRSWGLNVAARQARAPVLVAADADLLVPAQALEAAIAACQGGLNAVNPYAAVVDLGPEATAALGDGETDAQETLAAGGTDRGARGEQTNFCGGAFVIRRSDYERLGGLDERFEGWGGEDDAMTVKVITLLDRSVTLSGYTAIHLHHARPRMDAAAVELYRRNVELVRAYHGFSREQLAALCAAQRLSMGDIGKYTVSG